MPGPECKRRFDFDADFVRPDLVAIVRAVNCKAPGANGFQPFEACGDPILRRQRFVFDGSTRDNFAYRGFDPVLVRKVGKVSLCIPTAFWCLKCANGSLALKKAIE